MNTDTDGLGGLRIGFQLGLILTGLSFILGLIAWPLSGNLALLFTFAGNLGTFASTYYGLRILRARRLIQSHSLQSNPAR